MATKAAAKKTAAKSVKTVQEKQAAAAATASAAAARPVPQTDAQKAKARLLKHKAHGYNRGTPKFGGVRKEEPQPVQQVQNLPSKPKKKLTTEEKLDDLIEFLRGHGIFYDGVTAADDGAEAENEEE